MDPQPEPIDLTTWARREHFEHYRHRVSCTYAMTVEVDVTPLVARLREVGRRAYVAQVWALALLVNRHPEFRMTLGPDGEPATWPVVHPLFTVFDPGRETFAGVWTEFDRDFAAFHEQAVAVLGRHRGATAMFPAGPPPPNRFDVSSLPWTSFTAFSLQVAGFDHLAPIFTLGRYVERDGRTLLPLAVQVHHAAADGFHTARLVEELRALATEPDWVR